MKSLHSSLYVALAGLVLLRAAWAGPLTSPLPAPPAPWTGAAADCHNPGVSADGRFVVFVSAAGNLVTNDVNGTFDVFVRDRQLGQTILVSANAAGARSGNGPSLSPTMSADGRFVAFESSASDLVANDTNNAPDVFVRDLVAGTTLRVSQTATGAGGNLESTSPTMTPDGRFVLFTSRASNLSSGDSNFAVDLFVRDLTSGTNALVTRNYQNTSSYAGKTVIWDGNRQISDDGRWVAFSSDGTNLVRNDTNLKSDVFVRDLQAGTNLVASISTNGVSPGNGVSQDASLAAAGRYVAFTSAASNLARNDLNTKFDIYRWDRVTGTNLLASVNTNGISSGSGDSTAPVLSRDGNVVVFLSTANDLVARDTNTVGADLFRRDFTTGTTTLIDSRISITNGSFPVNTAVLALSSNGGFVLYVDIANNLVLFDFAAGTRTIVATNTPWPDAAMTDDAQFIVYAGLPDATGARNMYLYDRGAGTTELVSPAAPGLTVTTGSAGTHLSAGGVSSNGQFAVFESSSIDATLGDTLSIPAVWFCDMTSGPSALTRLNTLMPGFARGPSRRPVISGDGRWVAFEAIPDSTPITGLGTRFNLYAYDRVAQTNLVIGGVGSVVFPSLATLSQQGAFLAFQSSQTGVGGYATTIGQVYYRDLGQDTNRLVSLDYSGTTPANARAFNPAISPNGRLVAYLSQAANLVTLPTAGTNAFLWDSVTGSNILVSLSNGTALNQVSQVAFWANGGLVSFQRGVTSYLFDVASQAVVDTLTDTVNVSLSADGRLVACERGGAYSAADTNGTTDVYVIDRTTRQASLVSLNRDATAAGNGTSLSPAISPDGRYILFRSRASNLAASDQNGVGDVFLRDRVLNRTILLSVSSSSAGTARQFSGNPVFSPDGSTALFETYAVDAIAGDYNDARDVLVLRLSHGDSDGDGLPDDWELAYFNTLDRDGTGDFDGDGQSDQAEFLAGTDPTNAGSVLRVITLSPPTPGPVQVFWAAVPGKTYRVQYKDSLSDPGWTDLAGDVMVTQDTGMKQDDTSGAGNQRYYRVMLVP